MYSMKLHPQIIPTNYQYEISGYAPTIRDRLSLCGQCVVSKNRKMTIFEPEYPRKGGNRRFSRRGSAKDFILLQKHSVATWDCGEKMTEAVSSSTPLDVRISLQRHYDGQHRRL